MKPSSVVLLCATVFFSVGLSHAEFERRVISDVALCVPRGNIARTNYWWIPTDLPEGGVRFVLGIDFYKSHPRFHPLVDARGKPMHLYGLITSEEFYRNWRKPLPGSVNYEHAADPKATTEALDPTGLLAVYATSSKQQWVVWRVPASAGAQPEKIPIHGEVVAICRRPSLQRKSGPSPSCTRITALDGLAIVFPLVPEDLSVADQLDHALSVQIKAWKCERKVPPDR